MLKTSVFLLCAAAFSAVGCSATSSPEASGDAPAEDDVTRLPAFAGSGPTKNVVLGGHEATLVPVSPALASLLKEMSEANNIQNDMFYAASYTLSPELLAFFLSPANGHLSQKNMAFDMMFRVDGSTPGGDEGLGWGDSWHYEYENMGCRATTKDKADARFKRFGAYKTHATDTQIPVDKRNLIKADATKLVASFLQGTPADAKLYSCHWDNNDDTTSEALVLIDGGEARVVVAWEGG